MMKFKLYDHRNGGRSVGMVERMGVENVVDHVIPPIGKLEPKEVTGPILDALVRLGWSGQVLVGQGTKIAITSMHADVGLAVQFGNVSRVYADLLKLQTLYIEEKITGAILIVPCRDLLGRFSVNGTTDNRCAYERITREMPVFAKVITVPMLVYGVYTEDENHAQCEQ